jgi:outer membrane immunogenic protein
MKLVNRIALALAATAIAGSAFAADLPSRKAPPVMVAPAPIFTWTGFYVGANVGWAGVRASNDYYLPGSPAAPFFLVPDAIAISAGGYNSFRQDRVTFGGQIGYNYQMGMFVLGLEADMNYLGASRSAFAVVPTPLAGNVFYGTRAGADWMLTVRPRLGVAVGQFLPYVTGGLAIVKNRYEQSVYFPGVAASPDVFADNSTEAGWTLGGGVEWAFAPNWSIKAEYLHVFQPKKTFTTFTTSPYAGDLRLIPYTRRISRSIDTVRVGVNYKFGWGAPAPVVARY